MPASVPFFVQGRMAPSAMDSFSSMMRSGVNSCLLPRPAQSGQAPYGLLKEKLRGSSSSSTLPCSGQANFSEYSSSCAPPSSPPSGIRTRSRPSPRRRPSSTLSAMRLRSPSRRVTRSMTTSTSCFSNFSSLSFSASSSSYRVPSTRTRAKPSRRRSANSLRYSPLRPRTTGASRMARLSAKPPSRRSVISLGLCFSIFRPQTGQ